MNVSSGRRRGNVGGLVLAGLTVSLLWATSCGSAPQPFLVRGEAVVGNNVPPTITIEEPITNLTRSQGENFTIRWIDSDPDSNAEISFFLVNIGTNERILLVSGISENDTVGPDQFTISTSLIPIANYNLLAFIDDGVNPAVESTAMTRGDAVPQRVVVNIVPPGSGPPSPPPQVTVTQPSFSRSVTQDDVLNVTVQPREVAPNANEPYDPDSDITLYIVLDRDQNPNNDDPANPNANQIILLRQQVVAAGNFMPVSFEIDVDLATIPPLDGGEPYYIRATVDDGTNPRVHRYAVGTISVVQLASGTVDLFDVGRTVSGAKFGGFNPGANLGSSISTIGDFDADGVDDFAIVAQFGNPRNLGLIGEAYVIYGLQERFGGNIAANSVGSPGSVSGFIMEGPPIRTAPVSADGTCTIPGPARTEGISDISFISDLGGDGRPEILVGMPRVHGMYDGMDYDPPDQDIGQSDQEEEVTITFRQGEIRIQQDGEQDQVITTYSGVTNTTIDSSQPDAALSGNGEIAWLDNGAGNRKWGLIKFGDLTDFIPDDLFTIDITSVEAELQLRVFNSGGTGELFEALTDFDSQTTFNNYALNGGEPIEGVDYIPEVLGGGPLGMVDATNPGPVEVDVTRLVQDLLDGLLVGQNNELRFIIVAPEQDSDGDDEAAVRSSEFNVTGDRPLLTISYTRFNFQGATGCFPDGYVNNKTDPNIADAFDEQFTANGNAITIDSSNRDNDPRFSPMPARLEGTSIALELVGQRVTRPLDFRGVTEGATGTGGIITRADNYSEFDRIAGWRVNAGPFDCVDHLQLNQGPRDGLFGQTVASIGDLNNDGLPEIIISAPRNELYLQELNDTFGSQSTHFQSTRFEGSVVVLPGANYNLQNQRDKNTPLISNSTIPTLDHHRFPPFGNCVQGVGRDSVIPTDSFVIFAEEPEDMLGGAQSARDFNQDGIDDILCGAPRNDRSDSLEDTGAAYIIYGRTVLGDFDLSRADEPLGRPPMLRIRGELPGDQIGWNQATGLDVNGDRIDDVFISSPFVDFGGVTRSTCAGDINGDGTIDGTDLNTTTFRNCRDDFGTEVFTDDPCKVFDYDLDGDIDGEDQAVFDCLAQGGTDCCANMVDNGFVAIIFGGVFTDGDRRLSQIATSDLPGVIFFGASAGHRAGFDVSSAGDFNQDGFGDILISVPGETRLDRAGRQRLGVTYLVFGGTHLRNTRWSLDQVGTADLPGIIFLSPFVRGRPNEAAPQTVAFLGDINNDGFGDIAIGNPDADFIDTTFPQGPDATDAELGRRRNAGEAYIIYGNNFGSNRGTGQAGS